MAKIKVYRKDTGAIVYVPEHWMDHPVLKEPFRKTPSQKTRDLAQQTSVSRAGETATHTATIDPANAGDN